MDGFSDPTLLRVSKVL